MHTKPRARLLAVPLLLALTATACGGGGGGEDSGAPAGGGSYSVEAHEPSFLGPPGACYESECSPIIDLLHEGLVDIDLKTDELVYRMAESIESDDQKTWTITLKEGYKFQNGEPVNADAFIRAWNYTAYGPNAAATNGFFARFEGYEALNAEKPKTKELSGLKKIDDYTFEVTLKAPFSQFQQMLVYPPAFAPAAEECIADPKACNEKPIGNGPYQIGKWQHDTQVSVKRWDGYSGERNANAKEIVFKIYKETATGFNDYLAGNIDLMQLIPESVPRARTEASDRLIEEDSSSYTYLGLPTYIDAFKDPKVRHALSLGIDREAITENILVGTEQPATSAVPPIVEGHRTDACDYCTYDPERAKQLMKDAGGLPGNKITIYFNSGSGHEEWTQAVGNEWKRLFGVNFELKSLDFAEYLEKLDADTLDGSFRLGWLMDYPSMENYLQPMYGKDGSSNYTRYTSDEFEALMAKADAASSTEESIKFYQQAEDVVLEDLPIIPLWAGQDLFVYSENLENVKYNALDG
ncbi:MAG: peptide ABC transporter substrate-binding protein, partial [Carbonactinosporaceae bacterium]